MKLWPCFFLLTACAAAYLLYRRGIAVSKSIQAVLFAFQPGKEADRATLDSCTGWVRHVGRFPVSGTYEFAFDGQLSKGDAAVVLQDRKKRQLLRLNRQFPTGWVDIDGTSKYYLRWEFKSATGKCELRW